MNRAECISKLEDCERYLEQADAVSADCVRSVLSTMRALPIPKGACPSCGTVVELQTGLVGLHTVTVTTLSGYRMKCKGAGMAPAAPRAPAIAK